MSRKRGAIVIDNVWLRTIGAISSCRSEAERHDTEQLFQATPRDQWPSELAKLLDAVKDIRLDEYYSLAEDPPETTKTAAVWYFTGVRYSHFFV